MREEVSSREQFLKNYDELYIEYLAIDKFHHLVEAQKKAQWIIGKPGNTKAIFLAHGYMGSPNEMMFLAEPFIKAGFSVITFLIPGHGANSIIANSFKKERWVLEMKNHLSLVLETFENVSAIGFSTGGLLLHDYVINNSTPKSFKSLHLISPYFKQRIGGPLKCLDWIIEKIFNNVSVKWTYAITRFPDLLVMTKDHDSYNKQIPISTALEIKKLGLKQTIGNPPLSKLNLSTQLFLTQNDWTVKTEVSKKIVNLHYSNVNLVWYPGHEPHHLLAPMVSSVAKSLRNDIFNRATLE